MEKIQKKVEKFCKENDMISPPEHQALDVMSELGEVSKEILKMSNYGRKKVKLNDNIKDELGDVFYSLITLANSFDINLKDALNQSLKKYEKRIKLSK